MTDKTQVGGNVSLIRPLIDDIKKLQAKGGSVTVTPLFAALLRESLQLRLLLELAVSTANYLKIEYDARAWEIRVGTPVSNVDVCHAHYDCHACLGNVLQEFQEQLADANGTGRRLATIPDPTPKDEELLDALEREYQVADMASSGSREAKLIRLLAHRLRQEKK